MTIPRHNDPVEPLRAIRRQPGYRGRFEGFRDLIRKRPGTADLAGAAGGDCTATLKPSTTITTGDVRAA